MKRSKLFKLGLRDLVHGLILVAGSTFFTVIVDVLSKGVTISFKTVGVPILCALFIYLGKNFASNSDGELLTPDK